MASRPNLSGVDLRSKIPGRFSDARSRIASKSRAAILDAREKIRERARNKHRNLPNRGQFHHAGSGITRRPRFDDASMQGPSIVVTGLSNVVRKNGLVSIAQDQCSWRPADAGDSLQVAGRPDPNHEVFVNNRTTIVTVRNEFAGTSRRYSEGPPLGDADSPMELENGNSGLLHDSLPDEYQARPLRPKMPRQPVPQSHPSVPLERVKARAGDDGEFLVLVSNLSSMATKEDVDELFGSIGKLKRATLLPDGEAEVVYGDLHYAQVAVEQFHNRLLDGIPMRVRLIQDSRSKRTPLARVSAVESRVDVDPSLVHKALFNTTSQETRPVKFTVKISNTNL